MKETNKILAILDNYLHDNPDEIAKEIAAEFRRRRIEKLVSVMMIDYVKSQNKQVIESYYNYKGPDLILQDGIDDEKGCIAVEIKSLRQKQMSLKVIYDTIGRFTFNRGEINKLLLIFVNELPSQIRERINEKEEDQK